MLSSQELNFVSHYSKLADFITIQVKIEERVRVSFLNLPFIVFQKK